MVKNFCGRVGVCSWRGHPGASQVEKPRCQEGEAEVATQLRQRSEGGGEASSAELRQRSEGGGEASSAELRQGGQEGRMEQVYV